MSIQKANKIGKLANVVEECEKRARNRGILVDRRRFIGNKRDLLHLLERVVGERVSEASLEEYLRELGVRFPAARYDKAIRDLFPEVFAK